MFAYDSRFFKSESDVEMKYILPLLTQILGYDEQKDLSFICLSANIHKNPVSLFRVLCQFLNLLFQ